ncbi:MAG: STAS/SEC14 domain-containing protein [Alphaproteobacteria bacterium]
MQTQSTVTILPQTAGALLCISLSGTVTHGDYLKQFKQPLDHIIKQHNHFKLLVVIEKDFIGFTKEAADTSLQNKISIGNKAQKIAVVTFDKHYKDKFNLSKAFFPNCERVAFDNRLADALKWISAQ